MKRFNLIDWMRATADFMAEDRPDLFVDGSDALDALSTWMQTTREAGARATLNIAGYQLSHMEDESEGIEEWEFSKILSSCAIFQPENECAVSGWTHTSHALTKHIDLPSSSDQIDP